MSAWREALTRFLSDDDVNAERPLLDRVFPPEQCDDAAADRHTVIGRRGGNCVSDSEWTAVSSDSPWGGQR